MTDQLAAAVDLESLGPPSGFSYPDCNGSLRTLDDVRSLQEKSRLAHQLAGQAVSAVVRDRYAALATETEKALDGLRERIAVSAMGGSDPDG